jgi:hypothetical protein
VRINCSGSSQLGPSASGRSTSTCWRKSMLRWYG